MIDNFILIVVDQLFTISLVKVVALSNNMMIPQRSKYTGKRYRMHMFRNKIK